MRHPDRLAYGRAIYRPQDSRVRDRDLSEFMPRWSPRSALAIALVLSLALWAAIWAAVRYLL